jgi:hypothetical protein
VPRPTWTSEFAKLLWLPPSGEAGKGVRIALLSLLACAALVACQAGGLPQDPISLKVQWFSFVDGGDIRAGCHAGSGDRYRLIYNARFQEQVRVYEITAYDGGGVINAYASNPGLTLYQTQRGLTYGWQKSQDRLDAANMATFRKALAESDFYGPTPRGLELFSPEFYWVVMACEGGRFHYNAFAHPGWSFDRLTFPKLLFAHDFTGVRVNKPRPVPAGDRLTALGGGVGEPQDRAQAFRLVVGDNGLAGRQALF